MEYEQINLLTITPTYSHYPIKHDPYWDEIVKKPEQPVLTVENEESLLTVENEESLLTVENEESLLTVENEESLLTVENEDQDEDTTVSKITTVSKRPKGNGTGRIQFRSLNKKGKTYKQAWYDYQLHCEGSKTISRSRYIPKRLLPKIQELEASKACVTVILDVLNGKNQDD